MRGGSGVACIAALSAVLWGPVLGLDNPGLPPPDPWRYLALQRSQALLAGSDDTHPHPVRVLFYGQSIVQQRWWRSVAGDLQRLHPRARLQITNLAIAGFDAPRLLKAAEADVYPFRPDLIIFHSYGALAPGGEWEALLRQIRKRTVADVLLLGNHPTRAEELTESILPGDIAPRSEAWVNYVLAPGLCNELGFCFPDNRTAWKAWLNARGLPVDALLSDHLHLNPEGSALQADILRPYLRVPRLAPPLDPFNNGRVTRHRVGPGGVRWNGHRLRLEFTGNRVDLLAAPGPATRCQVRVDGQPPTSLSGGRGHGRTSSWREDSPGRPALLRVGFLRAPEPELWTLTITGTPSESSPQFQFSVRGSVTGPDGSGDSNHRFVSDSGRVVIDPEDWYPKLPAGVDQTGTELSWTSENRALDDYVPPPVAQGFTESVISLFHDLPVGRHVLELIADTERALPVIEEFRVYHPDGAMPGTEWNPPGPPVLRILPLESGPIIVWPAAAAGWRPGRIPWLSAPWQQSDDGIQQVYAFEGVRWGPDTAAGFFSLHHD